MDWMDRMDRMDWMDWMAEYDDPPASLNTWRVPVSLAHARRDGGESNENANECIRAVDDELRRSSISRETAILSLPVVIRYIRMTVPCELAVASLHPSGESATAAMSWLCALMVAWELPSATSSSGDAARGSWTVSYTHLRAHET